MPATPIRTCVACNRKAPKAEFLRIGKNPDGTGRGAYVCVNADCVIKAIKTKVFTRKLRTDEKSIDWSSLESVLMEKVNTLNA